MVDPAAPISALVAPLIQFAGALLGAGVGGVVTWLTTRRKLATERAFDRQLEWHEGMHRALVRVADVALAQLMVLNIEGAKASAMYFAALSEPLGKMRALRSDAMLFASPAVVASLDTLFRALEGKLTAFRDGDDAVIASVEGQIAALKEIYNTLVDAMKAVSAAHRRHLGLKPLPVTQETRQLPARLKTS
jgi:hypothetical protein